MSIFIKATDTFKVNFYVADDPTNKAILHVAADAEAVRTHVPEARVITGQSITFRFPNYRDNVAAMDDSIDTSTGSFKFHSTALRLHRLARLTKAWSFTDEEGNPVPINSETVGNLNPVLANYLGEQMEEIIGLL